MGVSAPVLVSVLLLAVELHLRAGRLRAALKRYAGVDSRRQAWRFRRSEGYGSDVCGPARLTAASYHLEPRLRHDLSIGIWRL